jgi:hypothetical protein
MSITKESDLIFERVYPSLQDDSNDSDTLEFTKDGLQIGYDTLSWEDIKKAHKVLFGSAINE